MWPKSRIQLVHGILAAKTENSVRKMHEGGKKILDIARKLEMIDRSISRYI